MTVTTSQPRKKAGWYRNGSDLPSSRPKRRKKETGRAGAFDAFSKEGLLARLSRLRFAELPPNPGIRWVIRWRLGLKRVADSYQYGLYLDQLPKGGG